MLYPYRDPKEIKCGKKKKDRMTTDARTPSDWLIDVSKSRYTVSAMSNLKGEP